METKNSRTDENESMISFESLSELTGFSSSIIKEELLENSSIISNSINQDVDQISLTDLRKLMLELIDRALVEEN